VVAAWQSRPGTSCRCKRVRNAPIAMLGHRSSIMPRMGHHRNLRPSLVLNPQLASIEYVIDALSDILIGEFQ
jgi:hypothetical protein